MTDTPRPLDTGSAVFGDRFEILGCLGARGMGIVYLAYDRARGERVALKTCRRLDALGLSLFRNEFRALADIDHPHLVRVYELFRPRNEGSDRWFFTMELVDGPSLTTWIHGRGDALAPTADPGGEDTLEPVPVRPVGAARPLAVDAEARLRAAAGQLALGVAALHARGLLHRDIKPDNVRVDQDGRLVLLDFGLAVRTDGSAGEGSGGGWIVGTRGYMSPQQAEGQPPTEADDWHAFGAVIYAMLTGRPPHRGPDDEPPPLVVDAAPDLAELALDLLEPDPTLRPGEAEIMRRLGVDPPTDRPRAALVGRRTLMSVLDDALARSRGGHAVIAHLWGPSGIGKSFAVEAWLAGLGEARRSEGSALVLRGRSHRREDVPFGPFDSLVDDLARRLTDWPRGALDAVLPRHLGALATVFPVFDRLGAVRDAPNRGRIDDDPRVRRDRAIAALREMLARIGDRHPVVLFLDDAQHGGADSATLLDALISPPDPPSLLVVSTARHTRGSPLLDALSAAAEAHGQPWAERCLPIDPLDPDESRTLARRLVEERGSNDIVDRIVTEAGGHPFLITELAAQARLGLDLADGLDLAGVICARVADLPTIARCVLELVALAQRPLPSRVIVQAAGASAEEGRALATLRAASLVRGGIDPQGTVETYHDAIRDAVAGALDPDHRRARHRALAEAIEDAHLSDPEPLVLHWREAGDLDRAAHWALIGGRAAVDAGAFEQAAALYRQALAVGHDDPATHRALAEALQFGGRPDDAADAWLAAAAALPAERPALERAAAEQWLISGRVERARPLLERLLRSAGLHLFSRPWAARLTIFRAAVTWWLRVRLGRFTPRAVVRACPDPRRSGEFDLLTAALAGWYAMRPVDALSLLARAARAGLASGTADRAALASAYGALVLTAVLPGTYPLIARLLDEADRLAGDSGQSRLAIALLRTVMRIRAGAWHSDADRARRVEVALDEGPARYGWEPLAGRALYCFTAGLDARYSELRDRLPEMLVDARRRGARVEEGFILLLGGVIAELAHGDPDAAEASLDASIERWGNLESSGLAIMANMSRVRIQRYRGDIEQAIQTFAATPELVEGRRTDLSDVLMLEYALTLLAAPDPHRRGRIRQIAQTLRRSTWGAGQSWAGVLDAALGSADGEQSDAVERLQAAATSFPLGEPPPRMAPLFDRTRARWRGDDAALAAADAALRAQGVADPERWHRAIFPLP